MDLKTMQFANFNITFGTANAPMLEYFENIIYPAFSGNYIRGKKNELPQYYFDNVAVKMIENEYVLVGNYVKSTTYKVVTTIQNGNLVSSPANVPTAPYSRFIIFLKNHRMVLVRNESKSPDIRSFQKTLRDILSKHINSANKGQKKEDKLPIAIVHIVDIPLSDTIEKILLDVEKINWMKLRFFPLNNDLDPLPLMQAVRSEMKNVGSKSGNLIFNSPDSKTRVKEVLSSTGGMALATLKVTDSEGETRNIKEDSFSSNTSIEFEGNITSAGDRYIVSQAKKNEIMATTSPDNAKLYERMKAMLKRFVS